MAGCGWSDPVSHPVDPMPASHHIETMTDDLSQCRAEIDAIDAELVALLAKRFAVVERVITYKQAHRLPADIPSRVDEVVNHVRQRAMQAGVPPNLVETLWRQIIAETIAHERRKNVA